jgi:hypothetical protein
MEWSPLGGELASGAAVASWGREESEIFAVLADGAVWNRYWDGTAWHAWETLGGDFAGQPGAAARDADRIDVFAIGRDGALLHRWWDGSVWVPWQYLDAPRGGVAVSCTWIGGELRVFLVLGDRAVWTATMRA